MRVVHIAIAFAVLSLGQPTVAATNLKLSKESKSTSVFGCWENGGRKIGKWWSGRTICFDRVGNVNTAIYFSDELEILESGGKYKLDGNKIYLSTQYGGDGWLALFQPLKLRCLVGTPIENQLLLSHCTGNVSELKFRKMPASKTLENTSIPKHLAPVSPDVISKSQ